MRNTTDIPQRSKRIVSNSLVLFVRMFAVMVINLYAVRIVLNALGAEDYGIYNAVSGVVLCGAILTTTIAVSIQRFYSYAIGKQAFSRLKEIFSASINIVFFLSAIILILFETVGVWFLNTQLTIPSERIVAANWIFQFSIISFIFSLIQLPYTASVFSHEDMGIYAFISLVECLLRLFVALLIGIFLIDGLIFYGAGFLVVALIVYLLYFLIARHKYHECYYQTVTNHSIYKELISFSGWTMYSTIAAISNTYGITIILNIFFGAITTAAYAISIQIIHAFQALCNSIVLAFRPPMVKSYAEKDLTNLNKLFMINNKLLLYIILSVAIPMIIEIRTLFDWWLGNVTEETVLFARLSIVYIVILNMSLPISTIIQATGNVKRYSLWVDTIIMLSVPISWMLFKLGAPSHGAIITMIIICIIAHFVRLVCLRKTYEPFTYSPYFTSIVFPSILIIVLNTIIILFVHQNITGQMTRFIMVFVTSILVTILFCYTIGINKTERIMLHRLAKNIFKQKN